MGHGDDVHTLGAVEIDDGEWESAKDKTPGSVNVFGPAMGSFCNFPDSTGNRDAKFGRSIGISGAIPKNGFPEFFSCLRMKPELLSAHREILQRAP